jgi:potassium-transporting ATPase KdpC subunit
MRRQLFPSIMVMIIFTVLLGVGYPLVVTGIAQGLFKGDADGSLVSRNGKVVGSTLIGQAFVDKAGNPIPKYFQSRPSAASGASASTSNGYDPTLSSGSNYGPSNPLLVGFIPGFNTVDLNGNSSKTNPFATKDDPYCVPTDKKGNPVSSPSPGQKYAKNADGTYVCDSNTVPERVSAYQQLNGLPSNAKVPIDAVTASGSGLDPDISIANARLQAQRVATVRGLPLSKVEALVNDNTSGRDLGILGEKAVNVLKLNLALDRTTP